MPSPFSDSGAGRALCPGQWGQQPCPLVPAGLCWGCSLRAPHPLHPAGGCPLRAPKLGPCVSVSVRVRAGTCLGCASLGREPAPAGDGLNVALPALTSAIKGSNPASPAHFLNPAGLFAGGKESRAAPKNASVGAFCLFLFFLLPFFVVA